MLEKKRTGKPPAEIIDDLMEGSFAKIKRRAERREVWREWVPRTCL